MLGDILKEERKKQGIDLDVVAKALKIRRDYLLAIENSQFEKLPGEVFARGYIRAYAIYLKIDPEPLIEEFNRLHKEEHHISELNPEIVGKNVKKKSSTLYYIIGGAIFLILIFFMRLIDSNHKSPLIIKEKEKPLLEKPSKKMEELTFLSQETTEQKSPETQDTEYTIKFIARELTWILVETDNIKKDFTLKPGESYEQKMKDRARIVIGNAGGLNLMVNGIERSIGGKSGEVKIINLP